MRCDKKDALRILQQLIRIRTPQPQGDELDAVKYIISLLDSDMFSNNIIYHGDNRASLISEMKGSGDGQRIALVCNLDTIGIEDIAPWEHPPFAADFDGSRVYGRGAVNNKGGVTALLLAALFFENSGVIPPKDVMFCFLADNDQGAIGAKALLEGGFFEGVDEILFVQPTDENIGIGQKGILWLDVNVTGRSSHVTRPDMGENALGAFIDLSDNIEALFVKEKRHHLLGEPACKITSISAFGPTIYSLPDKASGRIDIRFPPTLDVETLYGEIIEIAEKMEFERNQLRIEISLVSKRSAIGMTASSKIIRKLKLIAGKLGQCPDLIGLSYFTDASILIPRLGVPFVFIGPGEDIYGKRGDESISLDSVVRSSELYIDFICSK